MTGSNPGAGRFDPDAAVIIAVGGNLPVNGRPVQATLHEAVARLEGQGMRILARSGLWRSKAWPDPADPEFLNGVVLIDAAPDPAALIALLHDIEAASGRRRSRPNAPRPLDLDLVAHGRTVLPGPGLILPHPRAHERLFVMGPLAEVAPDWRHPRSGRAAADLAASATVGTDARPAFV